MEWLTTEGLPIINNELISFSPSAKKMFLRTALNDPE